MTKWILIAWMVFGSHPKVIQQEFYNQTACEAAAKALSKSLEPHDYPGGVTGQVVYDGFVKCFPEGT